ncbi:helix-turn-helix domain-containing protein [Fibrella arboris]|uniref:helix-turn-helix domain-containing protein n=1 Tax=Fibrella arboris TaxID=3242486 RepID=UPI0035201718
MTEGWVSQTLKNYRQDGADTLIWKKAAGPACRLDEQQLAQLVIELTKGAVAHGFEGEVWTRPRVNAVITKLFGVSYDPSQVGRLLKRIGWNGPPPRPSVTATKGASAEPGRCPRVAAGALACA